MSESSPPTTATVDTACHESTVVTAAAATSTSTPVETSLCSETQSTCECALSNNDDPADPPPPPLSKFVSESHMNTKPELDEIPAVSTATDKNKFTRPVGHHSTISLHSLRSIPNIIVHDTARPSSRWSERKWAAAFRGKRSGSPPPPLPRVDAKFPGIAFDSPTAAVDGMQSLKISKRGSLMQDPESVAATEQQRATAGVGGGRTDGRRVRGGGSSLRVRRTSLPSRAISADEDMLSRRVRLMYEKGNEDVSDAEVAKAMALENGVLWEESSEAAHLAPEAATNTAEAETTSVVSSIGHDTSNRMPIKKEAYELAGGIEYWQNIGAGDVDRYGFIRHNKVNSNDGSDQNPLQRVSTSLLLASRTPRRKYSIRPPSALSNNRSFAGPSPTRKVSDASMRPTSSQSGYSLPLRRSTSRFRYTNHLPHNRSRKFKNTAGDMLTLPSDISNNADAQETPTTRAMRKKEWRREDKWTKMAKPTKKNGNGGGMTFEFDTQSSKLIERTWKGIPDRWRATAWYAFLDASAKRRPDSPTEEELVDAFYEFQYISSPDDVQIDIDVPRTITSHIMFRRRYRGGQRLLFRVLHAMSLYFPDTGYVQGMAALAATLLAYYDEEHAFIMLVRLWQLRGLEQLYKSGFSGLMEALDDFEREWLEKGEVAAKLVSTRRF